MNCRQVSNFLRWTSVSQNIHQVDTDDSEGGADDVASGNERDVTKEEELESNRYVIIMIFWADPNHHLCL